VKTKSTKEIVEFYYVWKKTSHGRRWKGSFVEEMGSDDDGDENENGDKKGDDMEKNGGAAGVKGGLGIRENLGKAR